MKKILDFITGLVMLIAALAALGSLVLLWALLAARFVRHNPELMAYLHVCPGVQ